LVLILVLSPSFLLPLSPFWPPFSLHLLSFGEPKAGESPKGEERGPNRQRQRRGATLYFKKRIRIKN